MKLSFLTLLLLAAVQFTHAQYIPIDSFKNELTKPHDDNRKLILFSELATSYRLKEKPDSCAFYANKMLKLALQLNSPLEEANALAYLGTSFNGQGDFPKALEVMQRALDIVKDPKNEKGFFPADYLKYLRMEQDYSLQQIRIFFLSYIETALGVFYDQINPQKAWQYLLEARKTALSINDSFLLAGSSLYLGSSLHYNNDLNIDSALLYLQQALVYNKAKPMRATGGLYRVVGNIYLQKKDAVQALYYYHLALQADSSRGGNASIGADYLSFARYYLTKENTDSGMFYAKQAYAVTKDGSILYLKRNSCELLTTLFKSSGETDSAFKYQSITIAINDSLSYARKAMAFQKMELDQQLRQKDLEAEREKFTNQTRLYVLLSAVGVF